MVTPTRRKLVTFRTAGRYVHEDTARSMDASAGSTMVGGVRVALTGTMTLSVCGYWFRCWDENRKYWRWNADGKPVDCPECLARMGEGA